MAIISVMYTMCSSFDVQSSARNKVIRSMVRLRERNEVEIEQRHNHAVRVSIPFQTSTLASLAGVDPLSNM